MTTFLNLILFKEIMIMKINRTILATVLGLAAVSATAATIPGKGKGTIPTFTAVQTTAVFTAKSQSWSNPAFGDMGWTHHSGWGFFTANQGQMVTIMANSEVKGIHPGATVWYRGTEDLIGGVKPVKAVKAVAAVAATDTTPAVAAVEAVAGVSGSAPYDYVLDHFYIQNGNMSKIGAMTEDEPAEAIGNLVMKYVTHGYDVDGNTVNDADLKPKKDNVPGKLSLSFKAAKTGVYMFVVGGFNPDSNITDHAALNNIKVSVKVK
jgi:hypothetical protein